jgi:hypothetical protein
MDASGELVRHQPEQWPKWPLRDRLALVPALEQTYTQARARGRTRDSFEITNRLVAEMAELCRKNGIPFAMVVLLAPAPEYRRAQLDFMRERGIPVIECDAASATELKGSAHLVPGDGHPDAAVHAWWSRCVAAGIDRLQLLASVSDHAAPAVSRGS